MLRLILGGLLVAALSAALCACAPLLPRPLPDVLILGEQHDAPAHQRLHRDVVQALVQRNELAGVAIEMAQAGHSTAGLPRDATQAQVRAALAWTEPGWPWTAYEPAIMAAVRAGATVAGADLTREQLKQASSDTNIDMLVSRKVLQAQMEDVREGHCGLLPESKLLPLARAQIARDRSLAHAVAQLAMPGKTAVLITGSHHADPQLGVPLHLPASLRSVSKLWPPQPPAEDYCEQLRKHFSK
jgi:uncharacterized iron-regulated protein